MQTLGKYKQNLHIDGNKVISYATHVATMDFDAMTLTVLGWWSVTTSKHINYITNFYKLARVEGKQEAQKPSNDATFNSTGFAMAVGNLIGGNSLKEKNEWKLRMLKAGTGDAITIPEDWDTLNEEVKAERLEKIENLALGVNSS